MLNLSKLTEVEMNKYAMNKKTGQITLSDGAEHEGYMQIKLLRCNWIKVVNKKKPNYFKYKMHLPYSLNGLPINGQIKFRLPYEILKGAV